MVKLVLTINDEEYVSDYAFNYESKEKFILDLMLIVESKLEEMLKLEHPYPFNVVFHFCGFEFNLNHFVMFEKQKYIECLPDICTLDEWFESKLPE